MAKTLEHLSDFVFVTFANTTLARRDSYLSHLKTGIKPDTLAALRTAPLHIPTLFPDEALRQAEQDVANFETKGQLHIGKKVVSTRMNTQTNGQITRNQTGQPGKILETVGRARKPEARPLITLQDQPRASSHTNDNYCVNSLPRRLLAGSPDSAQRQTIDTCVNLNVVPLVHTAPGLSQKKEVSPESAVGFSHQKNYKLKYVKGASCVTQLSCVKPVTNVKNAASNPPVGARLQNFWQTWLNLGACLKIVQILK